MDCFQLSPVVLPRQQEQKKDDEYHPCLLFRNYSLNKDNLAKIHLKKTCWFAHSLQMHSASDNGILNLNLQ